MYVRTLPREIAARWIKPGDEVAMYEVEDGSGEVDSGLRDFCRTAEFVERFCSADWWLVIDGPHLVRPPADPEAGRVAGDVKHSLGGWWSVEPGDRGFVPDDMDHVGASSFVLVPIVGSTLGHPRTYFARPSEQFVIRERVKVDALEMMLSETAGTIAADAVALRLLVTEEPTEGQRAGAGVTVAERTPAPGHEACDLDRACSGGPYKCLFDPSWDEPAPAPRYRCTTVEPHDEHTWQDGNHVRMGAWYLCDGIGHPKIHADVLAIESHEEEERGSADRGPGEITCALPARRIPMGVMGMPIGRDAVSSDAMLYEREREQG